MTYSKEEFVKALKELEDADILQDEIQHLMNKASQNTDFMNAGSIMICHKDLVISLLEKIMEDSSWDISYFVYELNYGKEYKPGYVVDNDKEIDFSTAEALYDYLASKKNEDDEFFA